MAGTPLLILLSGVPFCLLLYAVSIPVALTFLFGLIPAVILGLLAIRKLQALKTEYFLELFSIAYLLGIPVVGILVTVLDLLFEGAFWTPYVPFVLSLFILPFLVKFSGIVGDVRSFASKELLFFLLLSSIVIVGPFFHVGVKTEKGWAYRAYFDHDFLVHLAVSAELSHGKIPPENPYFSGETLHYYWLVFQFPAICYRASGCKFLLEKYLLGLNITVAFSFLTILFFLLRKIVFSRKIAAVTGFITIFCGSYEGIYWLFTKHFIRWDFHRFRGINIDGLTRWVLGPPQIDTLLRALFFTPQHLTALSLFCIYVFATYPGKSGDKRISRGFIAVVVFTISAISAFISIFLIIWIVGSKFVSFFYSRKFHLWTLFFETCVIGLSFFFFFILKMYAFNGHHIVLGALKNSPGEIFKIMFFNYGFLPVIAFIGMIFSFRANRIEVLAFCLFFFISLFFIFGLTIEDYENEFGLRGGFVLYILSSLGLARYLTLIRKRTFLVVCSMILFVPGLITTSMDVYNLQDVTNLKYTYTVTPLLRNVFEWIKRNVPPHEIFQRDPEIFSSFRHGIVPNVIPPFAEHRVCCGRTYYAAQFQVGKERAEERVKELKQVFESDNALDVIKAQKRFDIDYWLIGPEEIEAYPETISKFFSSLFVDVDYENSEYRVVHATSERLPKPVRAYLENERIPLPPEIELVETPDNGSNRKADIQPLNGLKRYPVAHDWVFSPSSVRYGEECLLAVENPVMFKLKIPPNTYCLDLDLYFIDCSSDVSQEIGIFIDDNILGSLHLKNGWHTYGISIPRSACNSEVVVTIIAKHFMTPEDYCRNAADYSIGTSGFVVPNSVFIRVGPVRNMPKNYADIFYGGKNISTYKEGFILAKLSERPEVETFDPSSDSSDNERLRQWIQSLNPGDIVCGVQLGNPETGLSDEAWAALKLLGLKKDPRMFQGDYAFIGVKGAESGTVPEVYACQKSDFIYIGPREGNTVFSFALGNCQFILR